MTAWANTSPSVTAKMNRARREREALNSIDPVVRYKTREQILNRSMAELSSALVEQAKFNAKAAEQQELEAQRFEREYYKYR